LVLTKSKRSQRGGSFLKPIFWYLRRIVAGSTGKLETKSLRETFFDSATE
jgi:hypothetical protein